jgi:uncharacterized protein (DUF1697 family)
MKRVAGLLRAVNVGGRQLLMADLKRIVADAGFEAPETLLASGNVIFGTPLADTLTSERLRSALARDAGLATEVLVRDASQLEAVLQANPFPQEALETPSRLMAVFLDAEPQGDLAALAPACVAGEAVRAGPGCLYIHYPHGAGTSKLTNGLIERRLKVCSTARNWNTVGKLAKLVSRPRGSP